MGSRIALGQPAKEIRRSCSLQAGGENQFNLNAHRSALCGPAHIKGELS